MDTEAVMLEPPSTVADQLETAVQELKKMQVPPWLLTPQLHLAPPAKPLAMPASYVCRHDTNTSNHPAVFVGMDHVIVAGVALVVATGPSSSV
jgi:hypothetical protein